VGVEGRRVGKEVGQVKWIPCWANRLSLSPALCWGPEGQDAREEFARSDPHDRS
jgi:hypothetical protein